jgi:cytochrome P450
VVVANDDTVEWHELSSLMETNLMIVARLSSKVFLGDELCRNEEWLDITMKHTVTSFGAVIEMRLWPVFLRPLVQWFLPGCRESRRQISDARRIIEPVLQKRRQARRELAEQGKSPPKELNDGIEWFEQNAKGQPYDAAIMQLNLSIAAMHTTTDLLTQTMLEIVTHPEIIEPLRREMVEVLREGGWKKTSLYNMKLLDSVIKETQRLKPIEIGKCLGS